LKLAAHQEMAMKPRIFMLLFVLAFVTGTALAHGNKVHLRGTLETIRAGSLEVKTPNGQSVEVKLTPATVYVLRLNGEDKPAKFADLAAGDFVVIHATPKDSSFEADEVRFSAAVRTKPAAPPASKPQA
jgi:hypothetical protein